MHCAQWLAVERHCGAAGVRGALREDARLSARQRADRYRVRLGHRRGLHQHVAARARRRGAQLLSAFECLLIEPVSMLTHYTYVVRTAPASALMLLIRIQFDIRT